MYAHSAENTPAVDIYIPTYLGAEIWRDPLDSTRLAIIQFIGLSKAPVHAVFPDRSLSLSSLSLSFARSLSILSLSRFLSQAYALSLFFSLSRIYRLSAPPLLSSPILVSFSIRPI